jgi:hypothetical protein
MATNGSSQSSHVSSQGFFWAGPTVPTVPTLEKREPAANVISQWFWAGGAVYPSLANREVYRGIRIPLAHAQARGYVKDRTNRDHMHSTLWRLRDPEDEDPAVRRSLYRDLWQRVYRSVVRMRPARLLERHALDYWKRLNDGRYALLLRDRPVPQYALNYEP